MKHCYHCGRVTSGEPLFCNSCGRSYDVKLCPRLHVNPRYATVCSQCGSRELSTPQPKVSLWWKVLGFVLQILCGIVLVYLSLSLLVDTPEGSHGPSRSSGAWSSPPYYVGSLGHAPRVVPKAYRTGTEAEGAPR